MEPFSSAVTAAKISGRRNPRPARASASVINVATYVGRRAIAAEHHWGIDALGHVPRRRDRHFMQETERACSAACKGHRERRAFVRDLDVVEPDALKVSAAVACGLEA